MRSDDEGRLLNFSSTGLSLGRNQPSRWGVTTHESEQ